MSRLRQVTNHLYVLVYWQVEVGSDGEEDSTSLWGCHTDRAQLILN